MITSEVGLLSIGGGVAPELFKRELDVVLQNITDINTPAKETRKIFMEFTIKPTERRDMCNVLVKCRSSIPGVKPQEALFYLGKKDGKAVAVAHDPKQERFEFKSPVIEVVGE